MFFKKNATELIICTLLFSIGCIFFTLVSDDYGGFLFYGLPSGQFSDYPYLDFYFIGIIGIQYLFGFFYIILPNYNWVAVFFLLFLFASFWLVLWTIRTIALKKVTKKNLIIYIQLLFALFFLENIISISHTRFSLVLCGIALFNLAFIEQISRKEAFFFSLIFVLGTLIRPESSIGMILLITGAYLIWRFDLLYIIKRLIAPILFTSILFGGIALDWHYTNDFVKKIEPEIEYKMMARKVVDLGTMKTAEDSIKYQLARQGMWFDYKTLTPEYLRSIQLQGFSLNPNQVTDQKLARPHSFGLGIDLGIQHIIDVALHVLSFYLDYTFIPFFILTLIGLSLAKPKTCIRIALFVLYTFVLIYTIDYNAFMIGERHFISIQIISMVVLLYYFFHEIQWETLSTTTRMLFYVSLSIGIAITLLHYKKTNTASAAEMNYHQEAMKKIEHIYKNRLIVVTNDNYYLFDRNFSIIKKQYTQNKYILFDVFTYSLTPNYLNYLSRQCNCDSSDPVAFFQWLANQKALYISKPKRFDLTEQYMRLIHHQNLKFVAPENIEQLMAGEDSSSMDYQLKKVTIESEPAL